MFSESPTVAIALSDRRSRVSRIISSEMSRALSRISGKASSTRLRNAPGPHPMSISRSGFRFPISSS